MKTIKAIVRLNERDARRVDLINFQAARIEELERLVAQQKIELEWYEAEACKKDASLVVLLEANERMAAELAKRQWVSVEERLPEEPKAVMVFMSDGHADIGIYQNCFWYWHTEEIPHWWGYGDDSIVTHWRPLPEPPGNG